MWYKQSKLYETMILIIAYDICLHFYVSKHQEKTSNASHHLFVV